VAAVADEVLHNNVGTVGLEGNTVVAIIDVRVLDDNVGAAVCVPTVGVLGRILAGAAAEDVNVGENDVSRVGDECVPLWAVAELQVSNSSTLKTDGAEEDGTQNVNVLGIEVVPGLAVAVKSTTTIDVDILATKLEEGGGVLEGLVEGVLLPVVGVVGELDGSLDVWNFY
jgi:hypothetical protein